MSGARRTRAGGQGRQAQPRNQRRSQARNLPAQRRQQIVPQAAKGQGRGRQRRTAEAEIGGDGRLAFSKHHPSSMAAGQTTHIPVPLSEAASVPYIGKVDFDLDTKEDGNTTNLLVCIPANNAVAAMAWEWRTTSTDDTTPVLPTVIHYEHIKKKLGITGFAAVAADVRICNVSKAVDVAGGVYTLNARGSFEGLDKMGAFQSGTGQGPNGADTYQSYSTATTAKALNAVAQSILSNPEHKFMSASELRTKHTVACVPKKAIPDVTFNYDTVNIPQNRITKFQEPALTSQQLPASKAAGTAVGSDGHGPANGRESNAPADIGVMHNNEGRNNLTALYFYIPYQSAKNIYHFTASTHFRMRFSPEDMMASMATLPPTAPPSYFNRVRDMLEANGSTMKPVIEYAVRHGLMPYMRRQMALMN